MGVVFHHQQDRIARFDCKTIISDMLDDAIDRSRAQQRWRMDFRLGNLICRRPDARRRADIFDRQIESERASCARGASQLNFATEQVRQFTADGKTKASAAVLSAGTGVGLLESFKNNLLLFGWNADTGIRHFECDHGRRMTENGVVRAPAANRG